MVGRTFPAARAFALLLSVGVLGAACGGPTLPILDALPPVRISVDGAALKVPLGTTLGAIIEDRGLSATNGRLLSVSGEVLDHFADPGRILLDGRRRPAATRLLDGDRITVVNGEDHVEETRRVAEALAGPRVGNPERTLATYPTTQITVTGEVSGEVVSITDVPHGPGTAPRAVALTFDDGPWPLDTKRVLAVLKRFHVPATFFMVGSLVERDPNIARAVKAAGYPIGDHSYDHPISPALADLSPEKITAEIADAKDALSAIGIEPTLFRPPGGSYDDFVVQEARREGMRVVMWSVDPEDWRSGSTAKEVAKSVLFHVRPGSIILLHDGGGDAAHTIKALPSIIRGIRKMGLTFTTVPARSP